MRKYDVSEEINHYRATRNNCYMRKNMSTRKGRLGPDARKFSSAKISTFTVFEHRSVRLLDKIRILIKITSYDIATFELGILIKIM